MAQVLKEIVGKLKAGSITREQLRFYIIAVVCLGMVVYGYQNILAGPLRNRMAVIQHQISELEEQLQKLPPVDGSLEQQARRIATLKGKMAAEQEALVRLQERMATDKDVSRVVKTLALTANPKDFTLLALRKKTPIIKENYLIQPFTVDFQADYQKMADYLRAFSRGKKLYTVDELQIMTMEEILPQVEVRLVINNYRFQTDRSIANLPAKTTKTRENEPQDEKT